MRKHKSTPTIPVSLAYRYVAQPTDCFQDRPNTCHPQDKLTQRAMELLALPDDGTPRLLLDIGCGSGLSGEAITEKGHQWVVWHSDV